MIGKWLCVGLLFLGMQVSVLLGISVTAHVDRESLMIHDSVEFKIVVEGAQGKVQIDTGFLSEFSIVQQFSSQSFQMVNNQFSASQIKSFVLRPKRTGAFVIPSTTVQVAGQVFQTQPISVTVQAAVSAQAPASGTASGAGSVQGQLGQVSPATAQKQAADVFLFSQVNQDEVFVGEEIQYQLFLFRRVSLMSDLNYRLPDFGSVLSEKLEINPETKKQQYQGKWYYVQEIERRALFAYEPGQIEIQPARAEVVVSYFYGAQRLESNVLTVQVKALPAGELEAEFSGVVGEFSMESSLETSAVVQGKPVAVKLSVFGYGNLKRLSALQVDSSDGFKVYQSSVNDQLTYQDRVKGVRHFEYIVVPNLSGPCRLPQFSFVAFSPDDGVYKRVQSKSIALTVIASGEVMGAEASVSGDVIQLHQDLRYIKEGFDPSEQAGSWGAKLGAWVWALLLGVGFSVLLKGWLIQRGILELWHRFFGVSSTKRALNRLLQLEELEPEAVISQFPLVLTDYLSALLGESVQGMPQFVLRQSLLDFGVTEEDVDGVKEVMDRCSFLAYAPLDERGEDVGDLLEKARQLVAAIGGDV